MASTGMLRRRLLVTAALAVTSSPILVTLMKKALSSSETPIPTGATRCNIPEDNILCFVYLFFCFSKTKIPKIHRSRPNNGFICLWWVSHVSLYILAECEPYSFLYITGSVIYIYNIAFNYNKDWVMHNAISQKTNRLVSGGHRDLASWRKEE
jgi:hypothetical protein